MRAVNLLPSDSSQRKSFRKEDPAVVIGSALGVIVLMAIGAGFMNVHSKVNADQQKLSAVRAELAQLSLVKKKAVTPAKPVHVKPIIPVPAVTSTCSTPGTWLHDVPRIWRTDSVTPFMPWM